ncbi:NADPH-dependent FMN reductase [Cordyceps militaris CM01]|uniref:NADPH-dependent FMN reductase n=2 Tax=Cordyceps militaris TaxID=73501 RepID=G3JEK1_CORMM|nr:NADPH-dependent FMN reductase [Cordyceps militaris CM01]ATY64037.1 NADPH-dependent FMN reductase [Cordyceps militaris]EGX93398.1 NADPH-dependent FMN reductase [Cordyceps militaris CM01]
MPAAGKTIALIIGSTRTPRLGPHIHNYIKSEYLDAVAASSRVGLETIDLADHRLPIFDEPSHPAGRPKEDPTAAYAHEHTRRWSALVRRYDGFVFFTPEYNGSVPAGLKTAIDALFYEWAGKPAGIVSYAGRGGASVAGHLRTVLGVVGLRVVPTTAGVPANAKTLASFEADGKPRDEDLERWAAATVAENSKALLGEIIAQLDEPQTQ